MSPTLGAFEFSNLIRGELGLHQHLFGLTSQGVPIHQVTTHVVNSPGILLCHILNLLPHALTVYGSGLALEVIPLAVSLAP